MANSYGIDSISCGMIIAFAMECFECNRLSADDTGGIDLRFGNTAAMLKMIELIAERKRLGMLLSEGIEKALKK